MKLISWSAGAPAGHARLNTHRHEPDHRTLPARAPALQGAIALMLLSLAPMANAQNQRLLPDSLNLEVVDGSIVPPDCMYPASITDATRFEIACVTMPRVVGAEVSSQYIGQLGEQGWRQGNYVPGGMTAVRTDENNCQRVLNIFPGNYPPSEEESAVTVLWFALDRTPRCNGTAPG